MHVPELFVNESWKNAFIHVCKQRDAMQQTLAVAVWCDSVIWCRHDVSLYAKSNVLLLLSDLCSVDG